MNCLHLMTLGLACCFIGNISESTAISKLIYKRDIRNYGSKNAGVANVLRVYGIKIGLAAFSIDFFKGLLCAYLSFRFYGSLGMLVCGLLCVIEHILLVFYDFRGDKGVAISFSVLSFAQPLQVLILLILFLIVVLITKYVSLGNILGCISTVIYGLICIRKDFYIGLIYILLGIISLFKHRSNINKLIHRKESKLGKSQKEKMKVLVINCGSSPLKYQLFDMTGEGVLCKGLVERTGTKGSKLAHKVNGEKLIVEEPVKDHTETTNHAFDALLDEKCGVIKSLDEVSATGHRVLHGGDKLTEFCIIDDKVKDKIRESIKFGSLHNPASLMRIEVREKLAPGKKNITVFDAAFHRAVSTKTPTYAIPYEYYEDCRLRKFGFHETSHRYITLRAQQLLGKEDINIIIVHLGNGLSMAAIKNEKYYDTPTGLTLLEDLLMGTRNGDLDPTVMIFLMSEKGYSTDEMNQILNKKSGMLGVSGISSDFRDLGEEAEKGNVRAQLALDMFIEKIKRYIGGCMAELGHVDAICFADGIGEDSSSMRENILDTLEGLEAKLDLGGNDIREEALISANDSKIKVYVVLTNKELTTARDTLELAK